MAVVCTLSNHYKAMKQKGEIDLEDDVIKAILMNTTFTFDPDSHATYSDISANELSTGNGYTVNDKTLSGGSTTEDDADDEAYTDYDDVIWPASGGSIGPTGACCLVDDTTPDDTVIGCIDFGADITTPAGQALRLSNIQIKDE